MRISNHGFPAQMDSIGNKKLEKSFFDDFYSSLNMEFAYLQVCNFSNMNFFNVSKIRFQTVKNKVL